MVKYQTGVVKKGEMGRIWNCGCELQINGNREAKIGEFDCWISEEDGERNKRKVEGNCGRKGL